jgi:hypothetical protein
MTKPVTIPNTFATATTAIPLANLDADFSTVAAAMNDANTYSNYAPDTGSANAYVVTLTGVSTTYLAGLRIQFKASNANTTASTLNVNAQGSKNITYQDGSALASGTIAANSIVDVMYDGTQFLLMNDPAGATGGDVVGPALATDNAIVRFDGVTGKLVQNSVVTIADSTGDISGVGQLNATTVDATNIEVTNIKAKDGTAAATIADSTGVITVSTQLNVDNLNFSVNTISSTDTNGNIVLAPNGTGDVQLDADTVRIGDSGTNATLTTNGAGDLILNTNAGTNSGSITIADGTNGNITITPDGTGEVAMSKVNIDGGAIDNTAIGASTASTGRFSSLADTGLTSGRVTYATTGGELTDSANLTFNGTDLTVSGAVNAGSVNATTLDLTNLEVTNIKAKDGTAAMSIADSTGIVTVSTQLQVDNLNVSGNTISSTDTNGNIVIAPNGTGDVQVNADTLRVGDSGAAATITTNGAGNLTISTNEGTNSGTIVINQGTNGNIEIAPNGTGDVYLTSDTVRIGDSNANATLTTNGTGDLILNTNSGTNSGSITIADGAGGDITATPNGNGSVVITNSGTSNALRITQTGSGNALLVEDSANPDASPFVVDASGRVVIGHTSAPNAQLFEIYTGSAFAAIAQQYGNDTNPVVLSLSKTRGTTPNAPVIVANNDTLGRIQFLGNDGVTNIRAAQIEVAVDGTPGTNDMPGRLVFSTTADGASSPTERVRINSAGLTTVGYSAATGAALSTTVAAKLLSANTTYTDSATAASGTVTHGTINSFDNPDIAASNASVTYTSASTVYIDGAPTAGSNVTITNPYALYVAAGATYLGGTVTAADPIVQQTDIGTAPNEIPLNQYLGALAYENSEWVAPQVGSGITGGTGTICKTSFATQGGIKVMQILIDLTGLNSGGTAGDIIGVNGTSNPCYIAQIPSTYTVLGGRMTCLETPAGGDTDIDLYSATEGTGTEDTAISTLTETQIINAGTQSIGTVKYFAADPAANTYFYLVGQGTSNATYTAGRFLIEVFGA